MNIAEVGYQTPTSWTQLKAYVGYHGDIPNMPYSLRRPEIEELYRQEQDQLKLSGNSVEDNIHALMAEMGGAMTALIANKYSYELFYSALNEHFQPVDLEIRHFCLWSADGPMSEEQVTQFMEQQSKTHPEFLDYCYHVNGVKKMSAPGIWHCQMYIVVDLEAERARADAIVTA